MVHLLYSSCLSLHLVSTIGDLIKTTRFMREEQPELDHEQDAVGPRIFSNVLLKDTGETMR